MWSEALVPKFTSVKPKTEKKQDSRFYDDFQKNVERNKKSTIAQNPVDNVVPYNSGAKTGKMKETNVGFDSKPRSNLMYQSPQDKKMNGRMFIPSTVLGSKMSGKNVPTTVLGRYANGFSDTDIVNAKRNRYSKVDPVTGEQIVISDYIPGSHGMTKAEYNRRRAMNPSMPEFGSYEYFVNRERALRPIMEEIANDADRSSDIHREWVEYYIKDENWAAHEPEIREFTGELYNKFKYQDNVIAEYKDIDLQLKKFEKDGVHYDENGEVDAKSGSEEANYTIKRLDAIRSATANTFTTDEMGMGIRGELPEDRQKEHDSLKVYAGEREVEVAKEDAYDDYDENKDNVYKDNLWGRLTGNYKLGRIGIEANDAGYVSFKAEMGDTEAYEVYNLLSQTIQKNNETTFINETGLEKAIALFGQNAPQMIDQMVYSTGGQLMGYVIGALAQSPGLGKEAGRFLGAAAVAAYAYRQTAGGTFMRLLTDPNCDLSVEDAKKLAINEAAVSAAIEFGLEWATQGLSFGTNKIAKSAFGKTVGAMSKDSFAKILASAGISKKGIDTIIKVSTRAGKLAMSSGGEYIEEALQEGVSITTDKYAQNGEVPNALDLGLGSLDFSQYSDEEKAAMHDAGKAGATIGFGRSVTRGATTAAINKGIEGVDYVRDKVVTGRSNNSEGKAQSVVDIGLKSDSDTFNNKHNQSVRDNGTQNKEFYNPTTDKLISKSNAHVTKIKDVSNLNGKAHIENIKDVFNDIKNRVQNMAWFGKNVTNEDAEYAEKYGALEGRITMRTLNKGRSYNTQYMSQQLQIMEQLDEIFKNGKVIKSKSDEKGNREVDRIVTLLSPVEFEDGSMGVVKLNVLEYKLPKNPNRVHENKILEVVEAKVKKEESNTSRSHLAAKASQGIPASDSSTMSIAKMLEFVKGDDRKYLPDDYEEYVTKQSKPNGNKILAGENAETANSGMLKDAMMMNAEGVDSQTILEETGWGIGSDGRWRFEIDNSEARLLETPELGEGERFYLLSEWLEHDGLYEAYPDLRYVQVAQMSEMSDKSYCSPDGETIIINPDKCVTEDDKLNAVLEEIQNSIQIREGFEEGASFEGTESYINSQKDNEEYEKYKSILGEENVPKTLEEFQEMKYNDGDEWRLLETSKQDRLNQMNFENMSKFVGRLGNKEVRLWYKSHDERILDLIDKTVSLEIQARQAHELRNQYKFESRELMKNQKERRWLDENKQAITFEQLVEHKKKKYGLSGEDIYKDIIRSSGTTNKEYDKKSGID